MKRPTAWLSVALLAGAASLTGDLKSPWTKGDLAYYMDENKVNFVRPGLVTRVLDAQVATDGTITARVKITDPRGLGLDRLGVDTPGTINVSMLACYIPNSGTQYVCYTTRTQTSPITGKAAIQAAADNPAGTWVKLPADGEYRYTFTTKVPANADRSATHTIGAYSSRNLTEFDLGTQYSDHVYNFVPAGGTVRVTRDVIKTATCNKCHDPLSLHGGSRRSVELCVMCHTPQTTDPDTGESVDMPIMVHRIHMGKELPSVQAGKKYIIIGNAQSVHDYSEVGFPAGVNNCEACHDPGTTPATTPAQAKAWLKPNRAACGACHDNVDFATGKNHADLPQVTDNQCGNCHIEKGELDFDVSIRGAHLTARFSQTLPGTVFEIIRVTDGTAGKRPTVQFSVKDKSGKAIPMSEMTRLALVLAGPTSDYATYVSENALPAQVGADGNAVWTFVAPIPADAKGSFSIGIEGYRNVTLLPGTAKQVVVRDAGVNKVVHFSVDGSPVAPRRTIVSLDKCNSCHSSLSLHGDNRNRIEQCVLCHNPNETDAARRPATAGAPQTVDFRTMIHRIHTGEELSREFTIYGFGGTPFDPREVLYPGDRRNCAACHVNGSENLPLRDNLLPVKDARGYINPAGPTTAACLGCHDARAAASHALGNTNSLGESCAVCHGPNADISVSRAHAR